MNEYTGWSAIIANNVPVVMLLFSLGFAAIAFLSNKLFEQKKEIEDASIKTLVTEIKTLVKRIDELFTKHDSHEERIDMLEKSVAGHFSKCAEREKLLNDIKKKQTFHINKFNDVLVPLKQGGHRQDDCPTDRSDRDN